MLMPADPSQIPRVLQSHFGVNVHSACLRSLLTSDHRSRIAPCLRAATKHVVLANTRRDAWKKRSEKGGTPPRC